MLTALRSDAEQAFDHYREMLNQDDAGNAIDPDRKGLARELARLGLPLSTYTQWYWKVNLHNLLHFLALRADSHAQWEIQAYAKVLLDIVERWTPLAFRAFMSYRMGGARLSAEALKAVQLLLAGHEVDPSALDMSPREWRELKETLGLQ